MGSSGRAAVSAVWNEKITESREHADESLQVPGPIESLASSALADGTAGANLSALLL
jgi:hypothetical protein